eukprot:GFUD01030607.1.p1 GENE.GFUD01030607.1~~GFUD01030607.1.p1  ORF type:complete len:410 (-),score=99.13 GFUD01030607.1:50-1279(-)
MDESSQSSHQMFLHETLWNFAQTSRLTDITFLCQDQALSAHRAILSAACKNLFSTFPGLAVTTEQATVFLPDWMGCQVEEALNSVYAHKNCSHLGQILGLDKREASSLHPDQETDLDSDNSSSVEQLGVLDDFLCEADQDNVDSYDTGKAIGKKEKHNLVACPWCAKQFKSKSSLEVHEKKVHLGEDLKKACEVCGQVVSKMKEHMLRKHPENLDNKHIINYQCPHCDYSTRIKSTLKQHILNIHTERNLCCDQCDYKSALKTQLNQHKKKVHGHANIPCRFDGCARKFVQECDLNDHIKRTHPTGFFNCHQCGKQFVNEEKMKRHIKMHNIDTEGLPCNLCTLRFITKQKLREHMNTHTGATPYKCPSLSCEKAFMSSSALSHHKKACPQYPAVLSSESDNKESHLGL